MKISATILLLTFALAGCQQTSNPTPAITEPEVSPSASTYGASSKRSVNVNSLRFPVDISVDRKLAFVGIPRTPGKYTGADIEAAAVKASGCSATIVPEDWAILGDLRTFNLHNLRPTVTHPTRAWKVALTC